MVKFSKLKLGQQKAMTLTELLVASALVGVVTLGLLAGEYTVRSSKVSSLRDSQLSTQMQSTMIRLTRDASLAVGDAGNSGIRTFTPGTDSTICFREATGAVDSTYTNTVWNCWWYNSATSELSSCDNQTDPPQSTCVGVPTRKFWVRITDPVFYTLQTNASGQFDHIDFNLTSRFDISRPVHEISNPQYRLSSQVSPQSMSR